MKSWVLKSLEENPASTNLSFWIIAADVAESEPFSQAKKYVFPSSRAFTDLIWRFSKSESPEITLKLLFSNNVTTTGNIDPDYIAVILAFNSAIFSISLFSFGK